MKGLQAVEAACNRQIAADFPNIGGVTSFSAAAEQVVEPGVECDALILAQGAVEILERFEEHEHEGIAEAT